MDRWLVTESESEVVNQLADLMMWTRSQVMASIRRHGGGLIQWARDEGLTEVVNQIRNNFRSHTLNNQLQTITRENNERQLRTERNERHAQIERHVNDIETRSRQRHLRTGQEAPTTTTMSDGQDHNMGSAPEEGGEQQVTRPKHIWRRFPNTETAALRWVSGQIVNQAGLNNAYMAYGYSEALYASGIIDVNADVSGHPGATTATDLESVVTYGWDFNTSPFLIQLRMTSPYNIIKKHQDKTEVDHHKQTGSNTLITNTNIIMY